MKTTTHTGESKMAHTPGPWRLDGWGVYSTERNSVWVASVMDSHAHPDRRPNQGFPSDTEGRANAHLLAAAPDLLEAASAYEEYMNSPEPTLQKDHEPLHTALLAAIALAEGK